MRGWQFGTRAACTRCGQDIEWHGRGNGWIDRGGNKKCAPYKDRHGEIVYPKGNHTVRISVKKNPSDDFHEIGTIEHQGKKFSSGGSMRQGNFLVAYLGKDHILTTWDGKRLGTWRILSTWRTPRSFISSIMHSVVATLDNGDVFTGRSAGEGMIFKGKLSPSRMKKNPRRRSGYIGKIKGRAYLSGRKLQVKRGIGTEPYKTRLLVDPRKAKRAFRKSGYRVNPEKTGRTRHVAVQVRRGEGWHTFAMFPHTAEGKANARYYAKMAHRKYPQHTIRVFA